MTYDVIVAGGGPAGLAFVRGLTGSGLRVAVVERQTRASLADPTDDGREIALTHRSAETLRMLGAWQRIDPSAVAPLRAARVVDGGSSFALSFDAQGAAVDRLGHLVSNHRLRRALHAAIGHDDDLTMLTGQGVSGVATDEGGVRVRLSGGDTIRGALLVAADSRFSAVRERLGIAARIRRLGRSMLVARVSHPLDHEGVALEWFGHGQTVALLPLNGRRTSAVLTLPEDAIARIAALDADALARELTRRTAHRLGPLRLLDTPHVYPLATVWSTHFAATRAALIGDAAVGMHPVTAHGFNLGLRSAASLAILVRQAAARRRNIAAPLLLRRYEAGHRLAAGPLFAATDAIVRLYTDDRVAAQMARPALLHAAARLAPVRATVSHFLMQH